MTMKEGRGKPLVSELSTIELENRQLLDDDSLRLVAEVRSRNLLTDSEWIRMKQFLREALEFLSGQQKTVAHSADGRAMLDPDADPRNADWLRIDSACRLSQSLVTDVGCLMVMVTADGYFATQSRVRKLKQAILYIEMVKSITIFPYIRKSF
jgi:hypothetical protein